MKYTTHVSHVSRLVRVLTPVGKFCLGLLVLVNIAIAIDGYGALGPLSLSDTVRVLSA